jgi:hypothetical protein
MEVDESSMVRSPKMSRHDLYETDFVEWTRENAARLRSGALEEADIAHIAEEIEDLGNNWERALESHLTQLLIDLLKIQHQSSHPNQRGWQVSILNQRIEVARLLKKAPSLQPKLLAALPEVYADARNLALAETGLPANTFPLECPWNVEQILDRDFLPQ